MKPKIIKSKNIDDVFFISLRNLQDLNVEICKLAALLGIGRGGINSLDSTYESGELNSVKGSGIRLHLLSYGNTVTLILEGKRTKIKSALKKIFAF